MIKISTTFDIYPSINRIPSFGELLDLANAKLKDYLNSINIFCEIKMTAQLHKKDESIIYDSVIEKILSWDDDYYAWFFFEGIPGGTDAYFWEIDDFYKGILIEEIDSNKNMQKYSDKIYKSIDVGYSWNFRRSAGQPGIIVLSYGLLAASLCMLTNGLIYSDDGAWDYSLFPITADDFLTWYFRAELSNNHDDKIWAEECISSIYKEIENRTAKYK